MDNGETSLPTPYSDTPLDIAMILVQKYHVIKVDERILSAMSNSYDNMRLERLKFLEENPFFVHCDFYSGDSTFIINDDVTLIIKSGALNPVITKVYHDDKVIVDITSRDVKVHNNSLFDTLIVPNIEAINKHHNEHVRRPWVIDKAVNGKTEHKVNEDTYVIHVGYNVDGNFSMDLVKMLYKNGQSLFSISHGSWGSTCHINDEQAFDQIYPSLQGLINSHNQQMKEV